MLNSNINIIKQFEVIFFSPISTCRATVEPEYQELGLRLKSGMLSVCEKIKQLDEDSNIRLKSDHNSLHNSRRSVINKSKNTLFYLYEEYFIAVRRIYPIFRSHLS